MSKLSTHSVTRLLVAFMMVFFALSGVTIRAQDTPTDVPTDPPTVIPTDVPTDVPTVIPTDVPTAVPTDIPTDVPTEAPTDVPTAAVTDEPTAEVTDVPTAAATDVPTAPPVTSVPTVVPEPPMSVWLSDSFDSSDTSAWASTAGWTLVPSESGSAWQVSNSNDPLALLKGNFFNVAVQARFLLQGGSAELVVRQSEAGNYTASIDATGLVSLYRAGVLLQQVQVTPAASGEWRTLRLAAVDGLVRVAVDNIEVIALADSAQLPTGSVAIAGNFVIPTDGSAAPENTFLADDFSLSVKTNEIQLYPTATPVATLEATEATITETPATATPAASPEASATSAPTAVSTAEPAMSLLLSDTFDSGDTSAWAPATGWTLVSSENGKAWQVSNSNEPLVLLKGDFLNVAVQARFLLQGGSGKLVVRQSAAGNYSALIDTSGIVALYRAGALLQQAQVTPAASGAWQTLRLSAVDGILHVAVDNTEVITVADAA
ncbi:MAG: PT domain-containing protein, partial [Anaerolineae bacterium]|nr:PT domain-containing protein [Anaerolineae bacterium]